MPDCQSERGSFVFALILSSVVIIYTTVFKFRGHRNKVHEVYIVSWPMILLGTPAIPSSSVSFGSCKEQQGSEGDDDELEKDMTVMTQRKKLHTVTVSGRGVKVKMWSLKVKVKVKVLCNTSQQWDCRKK